jgi:uncharacterized membrane protein YraQ (UPF0718 family)
MALILFTVFLWSATAAFGVTAWRRGDGSFAAGIRDAVREALFIAPRLIVGVLGAGFVAALLPGELVSSALGSGSGWQGLVIASVAGMIIPGGPVVAFAVGAAALEAGAGAGQVIAFVTAWLLMSSNRTLVWEMPIMGAPFILFRMAICLPIPVIVGALITLIA